MPVFLAPGFLVAAALAGLAVVALHFLAVRRPRPLALPTARFAPDRAVRAAAMARRPTDLLLLLLRLLALLLLGLALARPVWRPERAAVRRVVLVDHSAAVADIAEAEAVVRALARPGDVVLPFADSAGAPVVVAAPDSVAVPARAATVGRLTTALVAGRRAAAALADSAASVELVLVSPVAREQVDAATAAARAGWPGRLQLARVALATAAAPAHPVAVLGAADDALRAGAALAGPIATQPVRLARAAPDDDDAAWLARERGVLVVWPAEGAPAGWAPRAAPDTVFGVTADAAAAGVPDAGAATVVAAFARTHRAPADARPVAWWSDGEVAAVEWPAEAGGCRREVAIALDEGDLALRPPARRLLAAFAAPCGGAPASLVALPDDALAPLVGDGAAAVPLARTAPDPAGSRPLTAALLAVALALLLGELALRRRGVAAPDEAAPSPTAGLAPREAA